MNNATNYLGGVLATTSSTLGTMLAPSEILRIISLIFTIIGAIISMIVLPILNWYRNAKKDGKITTDEIADLIDEIKDGIDGVGEVIDQNKKEDKK